MDWKALNESFWKGAGNVVGFTVALFVVWYFAQEYIRQAVCGFCRSECG